MCLICFTCNKVSCSVAALAVRPIWGTGVTGVSTAYQNPQKYNQYYAAARETVTDPQVPAEPANCCGGKRSASAARARPTHTCTCTHTHTRTQACGFTFALAITDTCMQQTLRRELTKTHTSKHTPEEGYSKWSSQPSKALTSIRHAYTVRLPTDELHLSAGASAKQFQSEGETILRISAYTASEPACQTGWLSSRYFLLCVNCEAICFVLN